jgi:choline dehydrogenase-like flavoprotein
MPSAVLTAAERRTFLTAAEAVLGCDVPDRAADHASELIRTLPRVDRIGLLIFLRTLRYAALTVPPFHLTFSSLTLERRTRLFARLLRTPGPLRQGASAVRSLAALSAYATSQMSGDTGYDGPWLGRKAVPVLPAPQLPIVAAASGTGGLLEEARPGALMLNADVCVIGTGAGGAAALARLAHAGVKVIAVELGRNVAVTEYTQRELEMLRLLYRDSGLRGNSDRSIGVLQGQGVGGSTLHNTGLVYAPPRAIVERWRREHGFAWSDSELEACVGDAREALHASQIPRDRVNANNAALERGAMALGWRTRIADHNRAECSGCGYCMLGCAYNRKLNSALTYIPRAVHDGARILCNARVERIRGRAGARVVHCTMLDADGQAIGTAEIHAPVVVLAAGAIDTPLLLQQSGLGNRQVGRNLRLHPAAVVMAEFGEPVTSWRGLPQSVIVEEFATFQQNGRGGFLILANAASAPAMLAAAMPAIGGAHRETMLNAIRLASAAVLLHDEGAGVVRASRRGPQVKYWLDARDTREMAHGVESLARLYFAAGARRVWLPGTALPPVDDVAQLQNAMNQLKWSPHRVILNSVHPQGSCSLGENEKTSATNAHGQVHGAEGVYVADASLFPTSVGVPPQITVMALATAVADAVVQRV